MLSRMRWLRPRTTTAITILFLAMLVAASFCAAPIAAGISFASAMPGCPASDGRAAPADCFLDASAIAGGEGVSVSKPSPPLGAAVVAFVPAARPVTAIIHRSGSHLTATSDLYLTHRQLLL